MILKRFFLKKNLEVRIETRVIDEIWSGKGSWYVDSPSPSLNLQKI